MFRGWKRRKQRRKQRKQRAKRKAAALDLAERWVLWQIDEQDDEPVLKFEYFPDDTPERAAGLGRVLDGATIDAGALDQCDCVPIDVRDCRGRRWQLASVKWRPSEFRVAGTLTATYTCLGTG